MENYIIRNDTGEIIITERVIKKIILKAIKQVEDKIVFTDNKWKSAKRGSKSLDFNEINHIEITCVDDGVCVELNILIKGNYTANEITDELIEKIDDALVSVMGIPSSSVALNIQKEYGRKTF